MKNLIFILILFCTSITATAGEMGGTNTADSTACAGIEAYAMETVSPFLQITSATLSIEERMQLLHKYSTKVGQQETGAWICGVAGVASALIGIKLFTSGSSKIESGEGLVIAIPFIVLESISISLFNKASKNKKLVKSLMASPTVLSARDINGSHTVSVGVSLAVNF